MQTCLFTVALVSANRKLFMFMSHTLQGSFLKDIHESLDVKYNVQLSSHTLQASFLKYIHESLDVKYSVQLSALPDQ